MNHHTDLLGSARSAAFQFPPEPGTGEDEPSLFFDGPAPQKSSGDLVCDKLSAADRDTLLDLFLKAQEDERLKMGRELHDSTGQLLVALRLSIAHLKHVQGTGDADEIYSEIDETVRQIDREIRAFAFLNYPIELGRDGLVAALETFVRGFGQRTGLRVRFDAMCRQVVASRAAGIALLRVAQEALTNVHRHARAKSARVSLIEHDGMLELSVKDDGRGMPSADDQSVAHGVGLQGMRHRMAQLGGHFAVRRLKHGTKLVASLPASQHSAKRAA